MREVMTLEYRFYHFIKERFSKTVGIANQIASAKQENVVLL